MMRYVLYEPGRSQPTLANEISFLQDYIAVQAIRYSHKFKINVDIQGLTRTIFMEPLLLFPFVENAFKHGIEEETGNGFIEIVICLSDNDLTLSIKNSKAHKKGAHQKGIGIVNTRKRLDLLYPEKYDLSLTETDEVYCVLLNIILD